VYFALWNPDGYRGMSDWSPPIRVLFMSRLKGVAALLIMLVLSAVAYSTMVDQPGTEQPGTTHVEGRHEFKRDLSAGVASPVQELDCPAGHGMTIVSGPVRSRVRLATPERSSANSSSMSWLMAIASS
jgi:hypothetical protein